MSWIRHAAHTEDEITGNVMYLTLNGDYHLGDAGRDKRKILKWIFQI
jgi:hypothetical protein